MPISSQQPLPTEGRQAGQVLALAGIFQAAALVQAMARKGSVDHQAFTASIYSVLQLNATSTEAVFGGRAGLRRGLEVLCQHMAGRAGPSSKEIMRYVVSLLLLERKLMKRGDLLAAIEGGVRSAATQAAFFFPAHGNVVAKLADVYSTTLSTLLPRIIVTGEPCYLQSPENVNKIRALLLAGIRASVLWRQLGGSRWQLLLWRAKGYRLTAEGLLAKARADIPD